LLNVIGLLNDNPPKFIGSDEGACKLCNVISWLLSSLMDCPGDDEAAFLFFQLAECRGHAELLAQSCSGDDQSETRSLWKGWALQALLGHASIAHRTAKLVLPWVESTTRRSEFSVTADSAELLRAEGEKWSSIWKAVLLSPASLPVRLPPAVPSRSVELAQPWALQVREAALPFQKGTAGGIDGFKVGHFRMLCEDGLESLALLFAATDVHGLVPCSAVVSPGPCCRSLAEAIASSACSAPITEFGVPSDGLSLLIGS